MARPVGGVEGKEVGEGVARAGGRGCDQAGRRGGGRGCDQAGRRGGGRGMVRPKEGRRERVWPGR